MYAGRAGSAILRGQPGDDTGLGLVVALASFASSSYSLPFIPRAELTLERTHRSGNARPPGPFECEPSAAGAHRGQSLFCRPISWSVKTRTRHDPVLVFPKSIHLIEERMITTRGDDTQSATRARAPLDHVRSFGRPAARLLALLKFRSRLVLAPGRTGPAGEAGFAHKPPAPNRHGHSEFRISARNKSAGPNRVRCRTVCAAREPRPI
jgi:hypothetical protein